MRDLIQKREQKQAIRLRLKISNLVSTIYSGLDSQALQPQQSFPSRKRRPRAAYGGATSERVDEHPLTTLHLRILLEPFRWLVEPLITIVPLVTDDTWNALCALLNKFSEKKIQTARRNVPYPEPPNERPPIHPVHAPFELNQGQPWSVSHTPAAKPIFLLEKSGRHGRISISIHLEWAG